MAASPRKNSLFFVVQESAIWEVDYLPMNLSIKKILSHL
uniref:Uncharacterized protein MANES_03G168800 n=1 Tax=Rhizophora mucronata TaxID=61149 RepID=A0A2P2JD41_RHIMU